MSTFDTSRIVDFSSLFGACKQQPNAFFQGISWWDTSRVESLNSCFLGCARFNQPLHWDTSRVTDISSCFRGCSSFNQPLAWTVQNVIHSRSAFQYCTNFNQNCNDWDWRRNEQLSEMFEGCSVFNNGDVPIDLSLPAARSLGAMFKNCTRLNVPITLRTLGRVLNLQSLVDGCTSFTSAIHLEGLDDDDDGRVLMTKNMLRHTPLLENENVREAVSVTIKRVSNELPTFDDDTVNLDFPEFMEALQLMNILRSINVASRNVRTRAFTGSGRILYRRPYADLSVE